MIHTDTDGGVVGFTDVQEGNEAVAYLPDLLRVLLIGIFQMLEGACGIHVVARVDADLVRPGGGSVPGREGIELKLSRAGFGATREGVSRRGGGRTAGREGIVDLGLSPPGAVDIGPVTFPSESRRKTGERRESSTRVNEAPCASCRISRLPLCVSVVVRPSASRSRVRSPMVTAPTREPAAERGAVRRRRSCGSAMVVLAGTGVAADSFDRMRGAVSVGARSSLLPGGAAGGAGFWLTAPAPRAAERAMR